MSEQERERKGTDAEPDPDVEGHKRWATPDEAEPAEGEVGRKESDEPDVEAHRKH